MLVCKCGYIRKHLGDYEDYECPICNKILSESLNKTYTLEEIIEKDLINSMKRQLTEIGNDKLWYMIEQIFYQPKTRLAYRKYFLKAGGQVPKREV